MIFKSYDIRHRYGGPCWLCRRRDWGGGFAVGSKWTPKVVWHCGRHGGELYEMAKKLNRVEFDRVEKDALVAAGDDAGNYLDSIGKTDLANLTETEWITFLKRIVEGFGTHIEKHLEEVPF